MGRQRSAKNRSFPPNLYQNSAGYFYYLNPDKKKFKGLGRDRAAAFASARAANATLAVAQPSALVDWVTGKTNYTLAEWLPIYEALWKKKTKRAENTARGCKMYIKKLEACDFAWMKLKNITTAHIATLIESMENESGSATAIALRARTGDVFRWAETKGLIEQGKNPVTATYTPNRSVKRERLSLEQFHAVREHAPTWLKRAMMLALLTAQRREDIGAMKFADCRDGYLFIAQRKSQGEIKLQQDTRIRLAAVGVSIAEAIQECRDQVVSRFIVHHSVHQGAAKPGARVSDNGLTMGFQAARDAAGISAPDGKTPPSFHEIRSLAERLYRDEYGAEFAQAMLGHKNASMTAKYNDLRGSAYQVINAKGF
jgi:integrase